jgi:glutathione S-transferase
MRLKSNFGLPPLTFAGSKARFFLIMKKSALHQLHVLGSVVTSTLSAWRGTSVIKAARQPPQLLKLYDMEGSPHCRIVREALTALGLDVQIYPCPRGGQRFRPQVKQLGGKEQFPFLIDPNTKTQLYESRAIVDYLFLTYGGQDAPSSYRAAGRFQSLFGALASAASGLRGVHARSGKNPAQMLELWSFESSPYSRLVRERMTELELPYILHNLGKEQFADMGPAAMRVIPGPYKPRPGGRREKLLAQHGRIQVPYLKDPNTGVAMYESSDIIAYLEQQYG